MSTFSANIEYRPVKIGWCVRDNNLDDYKKALRLTHTLWGGRYNPIIPIENFELASELIEFFKVDVLFPVSDDSSVTEFISKFPYLFWPAPYSREIFTKNWSNNEKKPAFLDIFQAARCLRADLHKENALSKISLNVISWENNDPLANVFDAMYGYIPKPDELDVNFDYHKLLTDNLTASNIPLISTEAIDLSMIESLTINALTTYNLTAKMGSLSPFNWNTPGFYLGDVNNFTDLITFWNLRACGIGLVYYDPRFDCRFSKLKEEYVKLIQSSPSHAYEKIPSVRIWIQEQNLSLLDSKGFGEQPTVHRVSETAWNGLNIKLPTWCFKQHTVLGVLSENKLKSLAFQLPPKPACEDFLGLNPYLVATIDIANKINNEEETFLTPYMPQLNKFYGQVHGEQRIARAQKDGISFIIQHSDSHLHLYAIKVKKLIEEIFKLHGMQILTSDSGIKTSRLIKQLGGLQNCKLFKIKGVRELINEYKPTQAFTASCAKQTISPNDPETKKPNLDKYKQLRLDNEAIKDSGILFNFLIGKEVFRVGLNLKCSACELTFWRVIDDVKFKSICEYCGNEFKISNQLKDRDWAYRRSGIFDLEDHQAGGIPVVLTLEQLPPRHHSKSYLYLTATNINPINATINKCESDFIILTCDYNGRISIVISECKTNKEITAADVDNLTKVANALSCKHIDTYILFSKLTDFSDDEITRCMVAQEQYRDRVILLTDRELEGLFLYEEAEKIFKINAHALSWEAMAINTKAIFFDKIKKT